MEQRVVEEPVLVRTIHRGHPRGASGIVAVLSPKHLEQLVPRNGPVSSPDPAVVIMREQELRRDAGCGQEHSAWRVRDVDVVNGEAVQAGIDRPASDGGGIRDPHRTLQDYRRAAGPSDGKPSPV